MKHGAILLVCLLLGLLAGGVTRPASATGPQTQFHITIDSWSPYYYPASASVPPNALIRWDNPTASPHTITHDGCAADGPCLFDSGTIEPGGTYVLPGLPPGTYRYHCRLHPIMRGVLVVESPGHT